MIAECHEHLADTALISLDHDLNKECPESPDPGDGLSVAELLGQLPAVCPVILHSSNADRVWSMHNELRFGKWPVERVVPHGIDWIRRAWLPKSRELVEMAASKNEGFHHPRRDPDQAERLARSCASLRGLAFGDGIGEMMFSRSNQAYRMIAEDDLPAGPWWHTDDTEMAISVVDVLRLLGCVHQDSLARLFALRYRKDPDRGYGSGARRQLRELAEGGDWRVTAREAFGGQGSLGNGSAMRAAPIGAWFADDLDRVVHEARASAVVTHMHPEGVAGAVAVAVAAAMAWRLRGGDPDGSATDLFNEVRARTPDGENAPRDRSGFRDSTT